MSGRRFGPAGIRRHIRSQSRAASVALELPETISDLVFWHDANQGIGASPIASWLSRVGDGDAAQSISGERPTLIAADANFNGNDSTSYDGTDDKLYDETSGMSGTAFTIAVVFRTTSSGNRGIVCLTNSSGSVNTGPAIFIQSTLFCRRGSATGDISVTAPALNSTNVVVFAGDLTEGRLFLNRNDTPTTSAVASTGMDLTELWIGAISSSGIYPYGGQIADLLGYDRKLSDSECGQLADYLGAKHGVTIA